MHEIFQIGLVVLFIGLKIYVSNLALDVFVIPKGCQWAGSGQPNLFLLGLLAQWAGHNRLSTS